MRTCIWCDMPLPELDGKGHRRREYCSARCKQRFYVWRLQAKREVEKLTDPFWRAEYMRLVEQYKQLELLVQARLVDLDRERKHNDALEERLRYFKKRDLDRHADYLARLRALGMDEQEIREFDTYWKEHTHPFYYALEYDI